MPIPACGSGLQATPTFSTSDCMCSTITDQDLSSRCNHCLSQQLQDPPAPSLCWPCGSGIGWWYGVYEPSLLLWLAWFTLNTSGVIQASVPVFSDDCMPGAPTPRARAASNMHMFSSPSFPLELTGELHNKIPETPLGLRSIRSVILLPSTGAKEVMERLQYRVQLEEKPQQPTKLTPMFTFRN